MSDLCVIVNGKPQNAPAGTTVAALLGLLAIDPKRVAIERNAEVVPRTTWQETRLAEGDKLEIVAFIGGGSDGPKGEGAAGAAEGEDVLVIAGRRFRSRLLIGTGKYKSIEETRQALLQDVNVMAQRQ